MFTDDDLKRMKEINQQAFKAPWKPCEHGADSPYIFGSDDNPTLATLFWPAHPVEETEQAENKTYATADLICELRNKFEAIVARLEAAENTITGERCPDCPDQGWYAFQQPSTGEVEQAQCEFCYQTPNSRFHVLEAWRKVAGKGDS